MFFNLNTNQDLIVEAMHQIKKLLYQQLKILFFLDLRMILHFKLKKIKINEVYFLIKYQDL